MSGAIASDDRSLEQVLIDDLLAAVRRPTVEGNRPRELVRAAFAAVEGFQSSLQRDLVDAAEDQLLPAEVAVLKEESYAVKESGEVRVVPTYLPLKQRVKLTAKIVARLRPGCHIDFGEQGWQQLLSSLDVRNRLTHPKTRLDMDVNESEVTAALAGAGWYIGNIVNVLRVGLTAYRENREQARRLADALRSWAPGGYGLGGAGFAYGGGLMGTIASDSAAVQPQILEPADLQDASEPKIPR